MNYETHYNKLIERARTRLLEGYTERHHIVPRCMGGSDDAKNIAVLTAREHYIAHQLLVKIYPGHRGLIYAAGCMTLDRYGGRVNNKLYGWLKRRISEAKSIRMTGSKRGPMSEETKRKIGDANRGKKRTAETNAKNSASKIGRKAWNKGKKMPDGFGAKVAERQIGVKRGPHTEETKQKIRAARLGTKRSAEACKNMSQAAKRRKPMSEETKRKMSMTRTGQKRGPYKIRRTN